MGSYSYPVFKNCTALSMVTIGENVKNIPGSAFKGCTGLTSIEIPNSVTSIGDSAFAGCSRLTNIVIGNSVTKIGDYVFSGCKKLTEISSLNPTPPKIDSLSTFYNIGTNGILKVPKGSDYNEWMRTITFYLGYYNWTIEEIETV